MTRGRKPKPTHLKLIEGNPGKRPIRIGPERPVTTMPGPPDHLNADARTEWDRVAHGLHALRLLETVDRAALAAYCTAYARWVPPRAIRSRRAPAARAYSALCRARVTAADSCIIPLGSPSGSPRPGS
jgi:hypothetical protein